MATRSVRYADFAESSTITGGENIVTFPTLVSSVTFYLGTNKGDDFEIMLNHGQSDEQGPDASWEKSWITFPAGIIMTISDYRVKTISLKSTNGSKYSVWGFVSPGRPHVSYSYTT